ncbi:hypothetical protein CUJ84_pRLN3000347 (plasmid) [Rhizobium leguminosarum]|uniref:Uncharacterized protein n=1 Tax=Rhizobium leguminosarum TaxID=384 RepID=A0A2K9ZGZ7_RHILE|nr:hypothetical protein CUJ84_pRLN3000347 [Rhizobium leguminosarum]
MTILQQDRCGRSNTYNPERAYPSDKATLSSFSGRKTKRLDERHRCFISGANDYWRIHWFQR